MGNVGRNAVFWLILALLFLTTWRLVKPVPEAANEISYSKFLESVEAKTIDKVSMEGNVITAHSKDPAAPLVKTTAPQDDSMIALLRDSGVEISVKEPAEQPWYLFLLVNALPMVLLIAIWIFFMRQVQMGAGKGMSFGKSRAKLLTESQQRITFEDVAGIDEARAELGCAYD